MSRYAPIIDAVKILAGYGVDVKPYISRLQAVIAGSIKTEAMFLRQLWNYMLTLYRNGDEFFFVDFMVKAIDSQLNKAWREGADAVGVSPDEFTVSDDAIVAEIIRGEYDQVLNLGGEIMQARARMVPFGEFRAKFKPRAEMWGLRYTDTVNRAKAHFGKRIRLMWVMGATEEHCATCNALNGKVALAEEWEAAGVFPQNPPNDALECGGWRCLCRLEKTDQRRSPDILTELLDMRTAANLPKSVSVKYDPNQPRVPAGNSDGGQWTDGTGNISKILEDEQSIKKEELEHCFCYDKDGNMVLFKNGNKTEIQYTEEEVSLFRGGTLTHNHPDGYSFSELDIRFAHQLQLKEIRVVTSTATHILRPGINGWPDEDTTKNLYASARVVLLEQITENNITGIDGIQASNIIVSSIAQFAGLEYEVIKND